MPRVQGAAAHTSFGEVRNGPFPNLEAGDLHSGSPAIRVVFRAELPTRRRPQFSSQNLLSLGTLSA
jgi:hypothetical protein